MGAGPAPVPRGFRSVRAYVPGLSGRTPSPSTVNVRLAAVRGLYDFLRRMARIDHNPADKVTRSKLQPPAIRGLSDAEIAALKAAIPDTLAGERHTAIIRTRSEHDFVHFGMVCLDARLDDPWGIHAEARGTRRVVFPR